MGKDKYKQRTFTITKELQEKLKHPYETEREAKLAERSFQLSDETKKHLENPLKPSNAGILSLFKRKRKNKEKLSPKINPTSDYSELYHLADSHFLFLTNEIRVECQEKYRESFSEEFYERLLKRWEERTILHIGRQNIQKRMVIEDKVIDEGSQITIEYEIIREFQKENKKGMIYATYDLLYFNKKGYYLASYKKIKESKFTY